MASLIQVLTTLQNLIAGVVYPSGTSSPSIAGVDITVGIGWPKPEDLDNQLNVGNAYITVFKMQGMERNTTRFPALWQEASINDATLILTVNSTNRTVTITGSVSIPQTCMIIVNGIGYAYTVLQNDTLNTIASAISALIPNSTSLDNVVTISSAHSLVARVTVLGEAIREIRRQEQIFNLITWASTPQLRNTISDAVDVYFADIRRIVLPDGFYANVIYHGEREYDEFQKPLLYRRDLMYAIEYATTQSDQVYTITDTSEVISLVNNIP